MGNMNDLLMSRMAASKQASELQIGDEAYESLFHQKAQHQPATICELPISQLKPFYTADIGFRPYPPEKLQAFSQQLADEGLFERIIVRQIPDSECYEILAGHNRTNAWTMAGNTAIPAEIVEADDDRAITIATATNLLRRQDLSIIERGKAYKALLEAKNRQGYRSDIKTLTSGDIHQMSSDGTTSGENHQMSADGTTSGESRPRYSARAIVAAFFGVTEYEIRKAIKLTQLIPELQTIIEVSPKHLNLACAELVADYDAYAQSAFVEICTVEGYQLNKRTLQHITRKCPPPNATHQEIFAAWREARAAADQKKLNSATKRITFDRKPFEPYIEKYGSVKELEAMFLDYLSQRDTETQNEPSSEDLSMRE